MVQLNYIKFMIRKLFIWTKKIDINFIKRLLQTAKCCLDNPGVQFWFGFLVGPLGLMILDVLFGDKDEMW